MLGERRGKKLRHEGKGVKSCKKKKKVTIPLIKNTQEGDLKEGGGGGVTD